MITRDELENCEYKIVYENHSVTQYVKRLWNTNIGVWPRGNKITRFEIGRSTEWATLKRQYTIAQLQRLEELLNCTNRSGVQITQDDVEKLGFSLIYHTAEKQDYRKVIIPRSISIFILFNSRDTIADVYLSFPSTERSLLAGGTHYYTVSMLKELIALLSKGE